MASPYAEVNPIWGQDRVPYQHLDSRAESQPASAPAVGSSVPKDFADHPLYPVFLQAFLQATQGKGTRHGGGATSFLAQSWVSLANQHGTGFLTGQAAKKLGEATKRVAEVGAIGDDAWKREILGALVYGAMAYLHGTGDAR